MIIENNNKAHLIVQTAFLGDCILTFPLVEKINLWDSKTPLLFLCRKGLGPYIESLFPYVKALEVQKSNAKSYKEQLKYIKENYKIKKIFCVHQSSRSLLFSMRIPAEQKIYYSQGLQKFFISGPKKDASLPEPLRLLQQFAFINKDFDHELKHYRHRDMKRQSFEIPEKFKTKLSLPKKPDFNLPESYIALAPSSVWETKKWPTNKFATLGKIIEEKLNSSIVLLGAPSDKALGEAVKKDLPSAIDLTGQTSLVDCNSIIAHAQAFVGNDSGLTHMAALYDIPSVAIFGPTHESLGFRPWQNYASIASLNLSCSPCGTHGSHACPIKTHACMRDLKPELVFSHLKAMLDKKKSNP